MLISFINSLQQQANFSWRPYVTSAFMMHGLTAMTDVVANIVGGVSKLPLAKFIDLVGRPQGFLMCLMFVVACESIHSDFKIFVRLTGFSSTHSHDFMSKRPDLLRSTSHLLDRHEWCRLRF